MAGRLRDDRDAASGMLAFLIAGVIFVGSIGAILVTSHKAGGPSLAQDDHKAASFGAQAKSLADILIGSPGYGQPATQTGTSGPAKDWTQNPDALLRLGLMDPNDPTQLSYAKFDNLRRAPLAADPTDGFVNYPEALHSLGLDHAGLGFHIRTWPDFGEVQRSMDSGQKFDGGLRLAYIGHAGSFQSQYVLGGGTYNIRLCVFAVDASGTPTTIGALDPGANFHINSGGTPDDSSRAAATHLPAGDIPGNVPLNARVEDGTGPNDAVCTNYAGLAVTSAGYTYGQASIVSSSGFQWKAPQYNDYVSGTFSSTNFYDWSNNLFDGNPNDNADNSPGRNTNSDGHIVLTDGRPVREMVVKLAPVGASSAPSCVANCAANDPGIGMAPAPTCTATTVNGIANYVIGTTIRNDGTVPTQFDGVATVTSATGAVLTTQTSNTFLVQPGATVPIQATVPANLQYCPAGAKISMAIYDPNVRLATINGTVPSAVTSSGTTPPYSLYVDTTPNPFFITGSPPSFAFGGNGISSYSYGGKTVTSGVNLRIQVYASDANGVPGNLVFDTTMSGVKQSTTYQMPAPSDNNNDYNGYSSGNGLQAGNYVVRVCGYASKSSDCGSGSPSSTKQQAEAWEKFIVQDSVPQGFTPAAAAAKPPGYPYLASTEAQTEAAMLEGMYKGFCPYYFNSTAYSPMVTPPAYAPRCPMAFAPTQMGSVYLDVSRSLNDNLPLALATEVDPTQPTHTITDGATTKGSNVVASPAGLFRSSDVGRAISGGSIPAGTTVLSVSSDETSASLSASPTATAAGAPLTVSPLRPKYLDVLVAGSDIDQSAMSKPASQLAVRDWVLAGGHLVVFGSKVQSVAWLTPLFQSGIVSSSNGLSTPDVDHPLLHDPFPLGYASYGTPATVWNLNQASPGTQPASTLFTNVVDDGSGNAVLTLSNSAAFGTGRIVLTGWTAFNLSAGPTEARHLTANMVMMSYQDLFLDYGPPIPSNVNVIPASRVAWIQDPTLGPVAVSLVVYVFPQ